MMRMVKIPNSDNKTLLRPIISEHGHLQIVEHVPYKCWKSDLCRDGRRNGHWRQLPGVALLSCLNLRYRVHQGV